MGQACERESEGIHTSECGYNAQTGNLKIERGSGKLCRHHIFTAETYAKDSERGGVHVGRVRNGRGIGEGPRREAQQASW